MIAREVRIQQMPDRFDGKRWHTKPMRLVAVDSDKWMLVRRADLPQGMPRVISKKDWAKLELEATPAQELEP